MAEGQRARRDGWTGERRREFIEALRVSGCVADACRVAGLSTTSAYRLRARDAGFGEQWETALREARTSLGLVAWRRAVEGVEIPIVRGGEVVAHWKKPSDSVLRLLLGEGINGAARGSDGRFARARGPSEVITAEEHAEGWTFHRGVKCMGPGPDVVFAELRERFALIRAREKGDESDAGWIEAREALARARAEWSAGIGEILERRRASGQWDGSTEGWPE